MLSNSVLYWLKSMKYTDMWGTKCQKSGYLMPVLSAVDRWDFWINKIFKRRSRTNNESIYRHAGACMVSEELKNKFQGPCQWSPQIQPTPKSSEAGNSAKEGPEENQKQTGPNQANLSTKPSTLRRRDTQRQGWLHGLQCGNHGRDF